MLKLCSRGLPIGFGAERLPKVGIRLHLFPDNVQATNQVAICV